MGGIGLEPTTFAMHLLVVVGYTFEEIEGKNYIYGFTYSWNCPLVEGRHDLRNEKRPFHLRY